MKTDRTIRLVTETEKEAWNKVVNHPLQSWQWGDFRKEMGVDVVRLGLYERNKLLQGYQLTFHKLPFTSFSIGYFPKGPAPTSEMLHALTQIGREKKALYIQLEPDVTTEEPLDISEYPGLTNGHRPLFTKFTFILDLTKSENELLEAMHSKTRYNIRLAERKGVIVKEDDSDAAFEAYQRLSMETTHRQGFYAHNRKYHKTMWKILNKAGIAKLFTASYSGEILSAWIIFVWKNTIYYPYGASSRSHREVMAPNLLLWEAARWAKSQGYYYFDLWGAIGPKPDENDPWYGFHRFKERYNPELIEFIGTYDLVIHPILYRIFITVDFLRWFILKMKAHH